MRYSRVSFFKSDEGPKKENKYHAQKVEVDGETFDSRKEYRRWCELKLMERAGEITELRRQVKFELIPAQKIDGKVVERACDYYADMVYREKGNLIVEDVKSPATRTDVYKIKRKLMLYRYGIRIVEV